MVYSIRIGEQSLAPDEDGDMIDVIDVSLKNAPLFPGDSLTKRSNWRSPSYSNWERFAKDRGLYDLFYGARPDDRGAVRRERSLMTTHPGIERIEPSDLAEVSIALERYRAQPWPTAERIAGWDPKYDWRFPHLYAGDPRYDGDLARLEWLEWWMGWALHNCERPSFANR